MVSFVGCYPWWLPPVPDPRAGRREPSVSASPDDLVLTAGRALLQQLARHDDALDLVGALVDLGDLRVVGARPPSPALGYTLHNDLRVAEPPTRAPAPSVPAAKQPVTGPIDLRPRTGARPPPSPTGRGPQQSLEAICVK
jgi:hypothetical protein